jgi:hypothetical protein
MHLEPNWISGSFRLKLFPWTPQALPPWLHSNPSHWAGLFRTAPRHEKIVRHEARPGPSKLGRARPETRGGLGFFQLCDPWAGTGTAQNLTSSEESRDLSSMASSVRIFSWSWGGSGVWKLILIETGLETWTELTWNATTEREYRELLFDAFSVT